MTDAPAPRLRSAAFARRLAPAVLVLMCALAVGGGCARRAPEAPFSATGAIPVRAEGGVSVGQAWFTAQAFADIRARRLLGRGLTLANAELEELVRTDEFYRVFLTEQLRKARVFSVERDRAESEIRVSVMLDPADFEREFAEAKAIRASQGF